MNRKQPLSLDPGEYDEEQKTCLSASFCGNDVCLPSPLGQDDRISADDSTVQSSNGDALLAKEMNELSLDEREKVYEDIHGIPRVVAEDEALIRQSLDLMEEAISKIQKKSVYERAIFLSPRYVNDQRFRLLFLRAENFNAEKAAVRIVKHFEGKLELFGHDKLVKNIQMEDLNAHDILYLRQGIIQTLTETDRSGRPIILYMQTIKSKTVPHLSKLRVFWYLVMTRLRADEASQRKGFVAIVDSVGTENPNDSDEFALMRKSALYFACLPVRFGCFHYCVSDEKVHAYASLAKIVIGNHNRLRFRIHFGSLIECLYELATFGIPRRIVPINDDGSLKNENFLKYLDEQAALELQWKQAKNPAVIEYPLETDVLLGRGRPYHIYSGNTRLANLINQSRPMYETAEKGEKWVIAAEIVKLTKAAGGRFLKRSADSTCWVEVSDEKAREKVSQSFRTKPRRNANG